ncbi:MAG TPA: HAD-IA family hydrolase [Thermoanaerobaculia bacterium]|nr:HAD-IA family hydrolase [Thermoanaerobaculia bacterium]
MATLRPEALVFDLDGTLIDSRRDITTAINWMRSDLGLEPLLLEQVVWMVGEGAKVLVRRALADWEAELTTARLKEVLDLYISYYRDVCLETTRPYPGIEAMLAELAPDYRMAVLSNKGERLSIEILEGLDLGHYFREVLGGDSLPTRKPNPAGLRALADRFNAPVERLMLIGDSRVDAETARNAGCAFALVEWGFPRIPGADGLEADIRAATPEELARKLVEP